MDGILQKNSCCSITLCMGGMVHYGLWTHEFYIPKSTPKTQNRYSFKMYDVFVRKNHWLVYEVMHVVKIYSGNAIKNSTPNLTNNRFGFSPFLQMSSDLGNCIALNTSLNSIKKFSPAVFKID